jgi:ketosteroid isomerase-like protein
MSEMTVERATAFGESWNSGDPDLVASYFTDDGAFYSSAGSEPHGRSYVGRDQVRQAAVDFGTKYPGGRFENLKVFVSGDVGILEWELVVPDGQGGSTSTVGCDLLQFRGDRIHRKSAFQKRRT